MGGFSGILETMAERVSSGFDMWLDVCDIWSGECNLRTLSRTWKASLKSISVVFLSKISDGFDIAVTVRNFH
jgi:hypothetical protein